LVVHYKEFQLISAKEALRKLKDGNKRFLIGDHQTNKSASIQRLQEVSTGQNPSAIILSCSDSRVPVEIVFDQGLGDLFVARVAGNVVNSELIGSLEFAAQEFGTKLIVVMGHTSCGAVSATLAEVKNPSENISPNLKAIVDQVRPCVEEVMKDEKDENAIINKSVRANISLSIEKLKQSSPFIQNSPVSIIGAEYSLETGVVDFFDDV